MSYHHYSLELDALIHDQRSMEVSVVQPPTSSAPPPPNANWFTFATWGTLTATQNITNDRAPQHLNGGLVAPLRRRLTPAILRAKAEDGQEVGRALAWAQRLVFVSTACGLLHFSSQVASGTKRGFEENVAHRLLKLLAMPSDTPVAGAKADLTTSRTTATSLRWCMRSASTARPLERGPEATLEHASSRCNVALTAVEQDLLDAALSFVVGLIPRRLGEGMDWRIAKIVERVRGVPPSFTFSGMQLVPRPEQRTAGLASSRTMTDQVLVIAFPTETLRSGGCPTMAAHQSYYANDLADIEPPTAPNAPRQADLDAVYGHVPSLDRTIGDGRGSAARDWRQWDERLNWAVTLMRTREHDESLYWTPYSVDDEQHIAQGKLPHRFLDPSSLEVQPPLDTTIFTRTGHQSENYR